jgi:conjugative relaxase-like TrwC/TraI family protein
VRCAKGKRQAVTSYDVTFSPPKSWSVLWAALVRAGRDEDAAKVWQALDAGLAAAMDLIHDELAYTRSGPSGPRTEGRSTTRFTAAPGETYAVFRHHTSREQEPQLHIHAMLLNRVLCEDGKWRALHGSVLMRNKHGMDAIFLRVAEAVLAELLGFGVAARPDGKAREVVGVSEEARDQFSTRKKAITGITADVLADYRERWGEPGGLVTYLLAQQATLQTRKAKKGLVDRAADLDRWDADAAQAIVNGLSGVLAGVLDADAPAPRLVNVPVVVDRAIAAMDAKDSEWDRSHLLKAVADALPDRVAGFEARELPQLIKDIAAAVVADDEVVDLVPPAVVPAPGDLTNPVTGRSVYDDPAVSRYATKSAIARENSLVEWLGRVGAPKVTVAEAAAVIGPAPAPRAPVGAAAATAGVQAPEPALAHDQRAVVLSALTSGRRMELLRAKAGTGKTFTMARLNDATRELTGRGMIGFTTAQNAADVMAAEGVDDAVNIRRWLEYRQRAREGLLRHDEPTLPTPRKGDRVAFDEASMIGMVDFHEAVAELELLEVGQIIVIGDTEQLDAIDQGGAFAMLCDERAPHELTEVRRFIHQWERQASSDLREGNVEAAAHAYDTHSRIHGGDPEQMRDLAVAGYVADVIDGKESLVITGTTDAATEVSSHVRARLVEAGRVEAEGVELRDGNLAGVGDIVATRRNARALVDTSSGSKFSVVNRESWKVHEVEDGGALRVHSLDPRTYGQVRVLPPDYVEVNVELGYAGTTHAVQGRSIDTDHQLDDGRLNRAALYSGQTRGRERNTVYLQTAVTAWDRAGQPVARQTPLERWVEVADNATRAQSARTVAAAEVDRSKSLANLGPIWQAERTNRLAPAHTAALREVLGADADMVLGDDKVGGVYRVLRTAEGEGRSAVDTLRGALATRNLEGARSPAALLHRHIDAHMTETEAPGRTSITYQGLVPDGDDHRTVYLRSTSQQMDSRVGELGQRVAADVPAYLEALGPKPDAPDDPDPGYRWIAKAAVVAAYREQFGYDHPRDPIGERPGPAEPERRWVYDRAAEGLGWTPSERDIRGASRGELLTRGAVWEAEQAWMPPNVDERLKVAHIALEEATLQVGDARVAGVDDTEPSQVAARWQARATKLDDIAAARALAYEATADAREAARAADEELARRDRMEADPHAAPDVVDEADAEPAPEPDRDGERDQLDHELDELTPETEVEPEGDEEPNNISGPVAPAEVEAEPVSHDEHEAAADDTDPVVDEHRAEVDEQARIDAEIEADLETVRAAMDLMEAREAAELAVHEDQQAEAVVEPEPEMER